MLKLISSPEKYDLSYKKEQEATVVGIVAICVWAVYNYGNNTISPHEWYLYTIPFRIFAAIWVRRISDRQNRDVFWNPFLAFFFPAVTLVVMGQLKKLNLRFKIDMDYKPATQTKELRAYADRYTKKERYTEALFVYQYIVDHLPHDDEDVSILNELKRLTNEASN